MSADTVREAKNLVMTAILIAGWAALAAAADAPASNPVRDQPIVSGPYSTRVRVDWKTRLLTMEVTLDLASAKLKLPEGRLQAERMIERDVPGLAKDAVLSLQADSWRSIEDAVADGSLDPESLVALAGIARFESSAFTKDLRSFQANYTLRLDAIASLFLSGASPTPIREPLESRPTREYSGIVIYAKGSLPVHGEGVSGSATPCLFPRIFDEGMRLLVDASMILPDSLATGGVLGYVTGLGVEAGERVGSDPMRVMALELFGDERTDYVISREDALRILSSPGNRELLRRGRIVVVY